MKSTFIPTNDIRLWFTKAMSEMYQNEVPLYKRLLSLANNVNQKVVDKGLNVGACEYRLLELEHHGAIRVGTPEELSNIRRLFAVMGMQPVDYYDLSVAGIPVHSTAFRVLDKNDLLKSPFRIFCSLLRLDLIDNEELRKQAKDILSKRNIFPEKLLKLIALSEKHGGLDQEQTKSFIVQALTVFRWHEKATIDKQTYEQLKKTHGLIADVVSFKGPHINHLTPKILDIDECQNQFVKNNIKAKAIVEGPPKRNCPILLRQTSFVAIEEKIKFFDGEIGSHTARFGEVEQRGIALTPKGRELYDQLLNSARNANQSIDYITRLTSAFEAFPDSYDELRKQGLAYFWYSVNKDKKNLKIQKSDIEILLSEGIIEATPIDYEDFLPVSAAGIFTSNLTEGSKLDSSKQKNQPNKNSFVEFEKALGVSVQNSFDIYEKQQQDSLINALAELNINKEYT